MIRTFTATKCLRPLTSNDQQTYTIRVDAGVSPCNAGQTELAVADLVAASRSATEQLKLDLGGRLGWCNPACYVETFYYREKVFARAAAVLHGALDCSKYVMIAALRIDVHDRLRLL